MPRRSSLRWVGLALALFLSSLMHALPAGAGFGGPEAGGLLHVRSTDTVGLGTLRSTLSHSYYFQDVGEDSRYHFSLGRLGLAFGLGDVGHVSFDSRVLGAMRFASVQDPILYDAIGDSDWTAGLGDSELGLKLVLPMPVSRLRLAAEVDLLLPTGDTEKHFSGESRDYELVGVISIDLLRGTNFVPTRLHLNAGLRVNRNPEGQGLPPALDPSEWSSPFPPYYPALEAEELIDTRRQSLYGAGLEFIGTRTRLYGELTVETLYHLTDRYATRENLWQLGLGFLTRGPWRLELFGAFDINLSHDDFDTEFEPHYPRLVTTVGLNRSWQVLAGDPDRDGVRGDADLCPDRPEDFDGFEDEDGCPDPDNDRDGVPDLIDLAPSLPEDFDGFEDADGRPDLDNDNDGIADRDDLCPDRPEDFDGIEDEDGCPDRNGGTGEGDAEPRGDDLREQG